MTLAAQISKLCNSLPRRAAARGIFSLCQELFRILGSLFFLAVNLSIVGLVEGVNVFPGGRDCLFLLSR